MDTYVDRGVVYLKLIVDDNGRIFNNAEIYEGPDAWNVTSKYYQKYW